MSATAQVHEPTLERMKSWPREEQEEVYLMFYSAYRVNQEANPPEAQRNEVQLQHLTELWQFTPLDVATLAAHGDSKYARTTAFMNLHFGNTMVELPKQSTSH